MSELPFVIDEAAALADLDRRLEDSGCFVIHREVPGEIMQPRLGVERRSVRIDRILAPKPRIVAAGWTRGPIGVEGKRPGEKLGRPLSQALDYTRSVFTIGAGFQCVLEWVFLFPYERVFGDLQSVMVQNRIGTIDLRSGGRIVFDVGGRGVIRLDGAGDPIVSLSPAGCKAGSR